MTVTLMIPFNRLSLTGGEFANMQAAIAGLFTAGNGPFAKRCEEGLAQWLGAPEALLTTSCTAALEMAALLLDVGPGDEVIVPSFTFVSTANAFALRGARLVFIDSRPDTLNMDESLLEALITPRTKAIVPMHYAGVGCEMDEILSIAAKHGLAVVEDNAHGLFGRYRGRSLGTFGCLATQSFHETKNITCGEGGALVVNDEQLLARARVLRDKGTNRAQFLNGEVDKYTWVDVGSSFVLSDLLAAFLFGQLEEREKIQAKRRQVWERYNEGLKDWADNVGATLPVVPPHCDQAYHMFYLLMPSGDMRDRFIQHLREREIYAVFHYVPLHNSPMGQKLGGAAARCPVAEDVSGRLVRLPFFTDLDKEDQLRILSAVQEFSMV